MSITIGPPAFSDGVFSSGTRRGDSALGEAAWQTFPVLHREILVVSGSEFGDTGPSGFHYSDDDDFFSLKVRGEERVGGEKGRVYYYAFDDGAWHDRTDAKYGNRPPNFYERRGGRTDDQVVADYTPIIEAFKSGKQSASGTNTKREALQRQAMSQSACISAVKKIVDTCGR
jgi:hypothetical protein